MNILILANDAGGLHQFRRELIQKLLENHHIYISSPNGECIDFFKQLGCTYIETPIDRRGINPLKDIKLLWFYFKMIKSVRPDLIITYTIKPNIYGGIISRLLNKHYIANITGLGTAFNTHSVLKTLVVSLYKFALKKATLVFFENDENCNIMKKLNIVQNNVAVLPGAGVNTEVFTPLRYPEDDEEVRFLFSARIMQEKGIDELLEACHILKAQNHHFSLHILGEYEEDYSKIIEEHQKLGWLHYHGYQNNVLPYIQQCHCFVLPSWHEGMANTNLECASCERPIITTNIPGCKEAIVDRQTGFLCQKKNSQDLAKKMIQFIHLPLEEKEHMGKQARLHIIEHFEKTKVVNLTLDYINQALNNSAKV